MAELTVIYDSGQSHPIAPLLSPLLADERPSSDPAETHPNKSPSVPLLGPAALRNLLPVRSPGLQAGTLSDRRLNPAVLARLAQGNPRPFFLVGADDFSLRWLSRYRDTLISLGAVGLLVQADTENEVRRVAEVAQGLSMTLGSGEDLARALGIDRYPVLITRDGIRQ